MNLKRLFRRINDGEDKRKRTVEAKSWTSPKNYVGRHYSFDDDLVIISSDDFENLYDTSDNDVISDYEVSDGIRDKVDEKQKGGVITFSTDINAVKLSENKFINTLKQKVTSLVNRLTVHKKTSDILKKHAYAWSIGNFFTGRYTSSEGEVFDESSISVQIVYIDSKTLFKIAEELCDAFKQECVMVFDFSNSMTYFVDSETKDEATEEVVEESVEQEEVEDSEHVEDTLKDAIKFASKIIKEDDDEMTDDEMEEAVEEFDEINDSYSENDEDIVANNLCLMLENNDGNFYNSLFNALLKKAKRGVSLSAEQLANSQVVMNQSRKMRKELNEMNEDSNYATMRDDKLARNMFAENMIESVYNEVDRGK